MALLGSAMSDAQVNVTTYHNDIGRTGQNLNETTLNLSNVNANQFGKLFSQTVDGLVYAQPLYLSGITVNGATHNVVFVATEHDSVYAFDADSNGGVNSGPLWKASMLTSAHGAASGATTVSSNIVSTDITPEVGITGTPVIDPATGTLYVVSKTMENSVAVQRLHALDVTTGAEKFGGPVVITATVAGTGNGSVSGSLTFDPLWENQRPGLLLLNGIVYVGFAAHGDNGPWHGWIIGYNAGTLVRTGAYCASPNGTGSGFWMSGAGLAADQLDPVNKPFGRMFLATGNGDYNATKPYTNSMDYGDSHLNLDLTNGVPTITDEFTTNQQASLNSQDGDVGSGGLIVLPTQSGTNPHLAVQAGKGGSLYLINRDNMGGYNTTTDQVLQEQAYMVGNVGVWSTPAYWNGNVYYWGRFDYLKSFPLVNGLLSTTPTKSANQYGYPGATPSISANGSTQGIVWSIDAENYGNPGPAILEAHDASNVATTLYSSTTNSARDTAGTAVKFTVPTIANGKVYVGAAAEIDIYGLLNGVTQTSAPVITPGTESYNGTLSVTITDSTSGASIYYTTDGTAATTSSTLYTGPITVSSTETIKAIASATGLLLSAQSSATYTNVSQTDAVVFSLPTGTYGSAQTVSLTDATANSTIYYTTDGSTPTTSSTLYTGSITVGTTETITAMATAAGLGNSPVISQTYTIQLGATGISFPQGFAASTGLVILNGSAQLNDSRLQLTNGGAGENSAAWYKAPVSVKSFTNDFTFQLSNPSADGITFAIQNSATGSGAMGGNGYQLGYGTIPNSIGIKFDLYNSAGEGPDSTGLYVNGANPTVPAIDLSSTGINLHSDDAMAVHMTYDGTTLTMKITDMVTSAVWSTSWTINIPTTIGSNTAYVGFTGATGGLTASQKILTWSFVSSAPSTTTAATPTFSPAAGSYTAAQSVTISDTTSGATIYYTTNGTTPTTSSAVYSGPISVAATETVKAIAVASGFSTSATGSAAYTINLPAATPTFSPAGGTYAAAQSVTISDTTSGATIYYTTNGTTPTTSSTVYSGPISVAATETVKAIAVASGFSASATGSAAYSISASTQTATPTFSLAGGVYYTPQTITISDATPGAVIYMTFDGSTPTTSSYTYTGPISINTSRNINAMAVASGLTASGTANAAYSMTVATPVLSLASGTYSGAQTLTITSTTPGVTFFYTTNGLLPTVSSSHYTGPLNISSSETVRVLGARTGWTSAPVVSAIYIITSGTATPSFSPAAGTYTSAQSVTISDTTAGATIYYTTNGTTPTTSSSVYAGPISVGASTKVQAIAAASGLANSSVGSAAYTITPTTATPVISMASGTYTGTQSVTITDSTAGSTIYYTTNGTTPTTSSTVYSGGISVSATETLQAIAVASGFMPSSVATASYTITTAAPAVNYPSSFTSAGLSLNGATVTGGKLQLTDGGAGEARAAWFATPVNVQKFTTDFNFQATAATADGFALVIQGSPQGTWALGGNGYALGYAGITKSVAVKFDLYSNSGEGPDSTGFYTNGATPTLPSVDMTGSGIDLHSGDVMHAHITYDGTTLTLTIIDTATSASFTATATINIPSTVGANTALVGFTAGTGGLTAVQNILNWTYVVN